MVGARSTSQQDQITIRRSQGKDQETTTDSNARRTQEDDEARYRIVSGPASKQSTAGHIRTSTCGFRHLAIVKRFGASRTLPSVGSPTWDRGRGELERAGGGETEKGEGQGAPDYHPTQVDNPRCANIEITDGLHKTLGGHPTLGPTIENPSAAATCTTNASFPTRRRHHGGRNDVYGGKGRQSHSFVGRDNGDSHGDDGKDDNESSNKCTCDDDGIRPRASRSQAWTATKTTPTND